MKTQEQIQARIDYNWEKVTMVEIAIREENKKWFPNRATIAHLRKISDDCKAEVVHLSWVLSKL